MRPINKGTVPLEEDGQPVTVSNHRQWRSYLIGRIGEYCSYCEMKLNDSPQVEHVVAQDIDDSRALDWENLLLACGPCNRTKSNHPCPPETHYLPDVHNTYLAFEFFTSSNSRHGNEPAAFIQIKTIPPPFSAKASNTIALCALDRDTTADALTVTDLRWRYRFEVINVATVWKTEWDNWGKNNPDRFSILLSTAALGSGFFSIWFYIFENVPIVKAALIDAFGGTARDCFDVTDSFNPIWRNHPTDI
jgi:hypothetical protein